MMLTTLVLNNWRLTPSHGSIFMNTQCTDMSKQRGRRGFLSMELAMALPILMIVLTGVFEFSMLFAARGTVVEASRAGARKASMQGATREDVEAEVRKVLSPRLREQFTADVEMGKEPGDVVAVAVRVPMKNASPDMLWPIGFTLTERELHADTRMIKE